MFLLDYCKVYLIFLYKIYCDNEKVQINYVLYFIEF